MWRPAGEIHLGRRVGMRRLVGLILICVSVASTYLAVVLLGPPIRHFPGPPPEPGGDIAYVSDFEVTSTAFLALPLLAVFAFGIVLLVLPWPKRRGANGGDAP